MTHQSQADHGADEEDSPEFVFVVEYDTDAERKRVEYLFKNWKDGEIETPGGLVRLASGVNHGELYEALVAKVPPECVESYRLDETRAGVDAETVVVEKEINAERTAVEPFLEYILSKKKAVLQSPAQNEYEVYTKKGRAEVTYRLSDAGDGTSVTIRITGYSQAPRFLADFFKSELGDYSSTQE